MRPYQFKVSVGAILRDEAPNVMEWIAFHRTVGIDHFFLYDNDSRDGTSEILQALERAGIVTRIAWTDAHSRSIDPTVGPQVTAYRDLLRCKERTEWIAIIDADEFIVPLQDAGVPELLQRYPQAESLAINWRMFGSSGHRMAGPDLLISRFQNRSRDDFWGNYHVKTVTRTRALLQPAVHVSQVMQNLIVDTDGHAVDPQCGGVHGRIACGIAQVNHYFTKSYEEWLFKRARGMATHATGAADRYRPLSEFEIYDRNEQPDHSVMRFARATRSEMQALEQRCGVPANCA